MDRLITALRALGPTRILAFFIGLSAMMAILGVVANQLTAPGQALLYGGMNPEEASSMTQWLDSRGVDYETREGGSIYVPEDQVGALRLQAAGQGLVGASTTGYEIFDESSGFGTTSFVQNINARRALEGELARTISTLPVVQGARVHLVLPERRLFDEDAQEPSAAVALTVGSRILSEQNTASIARLVAASVPNLTTDNVTIINQSGQMLYDGKTAANDRTTAGSAMQKSVETDLEKSVIRIVERIVGAGNAAVEVHAQLNTQRVEQQEEMYNPRQQVARSEQIIEETQQSQSSAPSDIVGLAGNVPEGNEGGMNDTSQEEQTRSEQTINYEISKTVRNIVQAAGSVERLSVAVLVAGREVTSETGDTSYETLPPSTLRNIEELVKTAIGFNEDRGDKVQVVNMPFAQTKEEISAPKPPMFTKQDVMLLIQYAALLLGLLFLAIFVVRPALNALKEAMDAAAPPPPPSTNFNEIASAPSAPVEEESTVKVDRVSGRVKESMVKEVNDVVDQHPEESLSVVRGWMASDNPNQEMPG